MWTVFYFALCISDKLPSLNVVKVDKVNPIEVANPTEVTDPIKVEVADAQDVEMVDVTKRY